MGTELKEHRQKKAYIVRGRDLISTGLGIAGWLLFIVTASQPKNPVNVIRLSCAFGFFAVSLSVEHLRESDLLSLNRATDYENSITSDRLRLGTVIHEELHKIKAVEEMFLQAPPDRHLELARKLDVDPPNYAARQVDPMTQQLSQPTQPSQPTQTVEPDPTGDFDPEKATERENSGSAFIPAARVADWFEEMGKAIPESLIKEWETSPGTGISIEDGTANIVRRES